MFWRAEERSERALFELLGVRRRCKSRRNGRSCFSFHIHCIVCLGKLSRMEIWTAGGGDVKWTRLPKVIDRHEGYRVPAQGFDPGCQMGLNFALRIKQHHRTGDCFETLNPLKHENKAF